ncbi:signal peptidase I [Mediterraneibacter glycyrrhizinilyticus]|nr:signal peptidase I [Mediterraneibacter glycyrrhizinilyticus]MBM6803945.1 signal peptidase I [Mediterraneibacter glycyrrhizinilyticus]
MYKKHPVLCSMAAAAVVVILFQVFWGIAVVSGNSMTPYYEDGDLVLFNRVENPEKNQVVIAYVGDKYVIKRIVAVQGDVITICDNIMLINGEEQGSVEIAGDDKEESITLVDDQYFLMGDNRENSKDSRIYGVIYRCQIIGVVTRKL